MASLATWAIAAAIVFHALYRKAPDMSVLTEALEALQAEVDDSSAKLDTVLTFLQDVPALVAAAVTEALAAANVEAAEAAALIAAATSAISDKVDAVFDEVDGDDTEEV